MLEHRGQHRLAWFILVFVSNVHQFHLERETV